MKMDFTEIFVVLTMLWETSSGIRCYKCEPQFNTYINENLCEHFDYSKKYETECRNSTMCYKRETTSGLGNGLKIYERGCAQQTYSGEQERTWNPSKGKYVWVQVSKIHEVYDEKCMENPGDAERVTKTTHCYCRGEFCNGSAPVRGVGAVMMLVVGVLCLR